MKVTIVVTHLLGTGHLARALTLARAFKHASHGVTVISGGMHAPQLDSDGVTLVQLPPLRSDGVDFSRLLDRHGEDATDQLFQDRRDMLAGHLTAQEPDILITELFPFGRRGLKDEFLETLRTAHALPRRPLICASIRDILAPPSKPAKAAFADDTIAQFYDAVLVHSDEAVTPLDISWPVSAGLASRLHYTGFVAPPPADPHPDALGKDEIVVSAGGGDVGAHLFNTCLAAARRSRDHQWRLLLGGQDAAARSADLMRGAPDNVLIEPARPEFRQMLYHAAASVSLCGYNTALDILQSGARAVFVPFDAGHEVEQGLRAGALAQLDGITVLRNAEMTAGTLLNAVRTVLDAPARPRREDGFDGAAKTVEIAVMLRKAQT
jgi:predicted glycosyltransferase